jgi:hypothetical protein
VSAQQFARGQISISRAASLPVRRVVDGPRMRGSRRARAAFLGSWDWVVRGGCGARTGKPPAGGRHGRRPWSSAISAARTRGRTQGRIGDVGEFLISPLWCSSPRSDPVAVGGFNGARHDESFLQLEETMWTSTRIDAHRRVEAANVGTALANKDELLEAAAAELIAGVAATMGRSFRRERADVPAWPPRAVSWAMSLARCMGPGCCHEQGTTSPIPARRAGSRRTSATTRRRRSPSACAPRNGGASRPPRSARPASTSSASCGSRAGTRRTGCGPGRPR